MPKVARAKGHDWIYTPDLPDRYFLELHGDLAEYPWPISIVAGGGLLSHGRHRSNEVSNHAGVAMPSHVMTYWFTRQASLYKRAVEPEALYRGVLYGSTLAILALTSEARQGELVQVSADRFEPPRPYLIKDKTGDPITTPCYRPASLQRDRAPTPAAKGRRHDSERNLFNVSAAASLLQEIGDGLRARHGGEIPRVPARRSHTGVRIPRLKISNPSATCCSGTRWLSTA